MNRSTMIPRLLFLIGTIRRSLRNRYLRSFPWPRARAEDDQADETLRTQVDVRTEHGSLLR